METKVETEMLYNVVKIVPSKETNIVFNVSLEDAAFLLENVFTDKKYKYVVQPVYLKGE